MYFQRKMKVVDENMLKYNEDDVNYANRSRVSSKWKLCNDIEVW